MSAQQVVPCAHVTQNTYNIKTTEALETPTTAYAPTGHRPAAGAPIIESEDRLVVDEARSPRCAQGLEYRW